MSCTTYPFIAAYPIYASPLYYPEYYPEYYPDYAPYASVAPSYYPPAEVAPAQPQFGPEPLEGVNSGPVYNGQMPPSDAPPPDDNENEDEIPQQGSSNPSGVRMPSSQMDRLMKEGTEAFTARAYDKSARLFLQVGMADQDNIDAWLAYAISRFATGDYEMSANAIRRGVGRYPDVVNSPFDLRQRYGNQSDFQKQLAALRDFVLDNNGSADGWLVLGFVRHFAGERKQAIRTFETIKERFDSDDELASLFLQAKSPDGRSVSPPAQTSPAQSPGGSAMPDDTENDSN